MTTGEVIALYGLAPDVVAFLRRAIAAANDPAVSEAELAAFVFGVENPLLDTSILLGRAIVPKALLESPLYGVFMDLLKAKATFGDPALQRKRPSPSEAGTTLTSPGRQTSERKQRK